MAALSGGMTNFMMIRIRMIEMANSMKKVPLGRRNMPAGFIMLTVSGSYPAW
jgi:hypothetical protein